MCTKYTQCPEATGILLEVKLQMTQERASMWIRGCWQGHQGHSTVELSFQPLNHLK